MIAPHPLLRCHPSSPVTALLAAAVCAALTGEVKAQLQFAAFGSPLPGSAGHRVTHGDVDGDGDVDLVFAGATSELFRNDGRGGFVDVTATNLPQAGARSSNVVLGDVDGDGDLDMLLASYGGQNRLLVNDGMGVFVDSTATLMPVDADYTSAVELGDFDGDGDLDLVTANSIRLMAYGAVNRLYLNNGSGTFAAAATGSFPSLIRPSYALAIGDVDGDGDLDIAFGNAYFGFQYRAGAQDNLYLNDGSGSFTLASLPSVVELTTDLTLGDIDGDGDLDLVCSSDNGGYYPSVNRLYLNVGNGRFTDATAARRPQATVDAPTSSVALEDVDDDGDLDIVFGDRSRNELWINDGGGVFADVSATRLATGQGTSDAALVDIDGDRDLDLVFASVPNARLEKNLLRQLDAPAAPAVGQSYQLDVYARYGEPRLFDVALPYVSFAPASIPLPQIGTVAIDPAQAFPLPPLLIPQPAGVASTTLAIPSNPSLVGLDVYAQALHVPYPLPPRLTNATLGVVR